MISEECQVTEFDTKEEAEEAIHALRNHPYFFGHREYARPFYKVRKQPGKECYYVHARYFFYKGAPWKRESGGVNFNHYNQA